MTLRLNHRQAYVSMLREARLEYRDREQTRQQKEEFTEYYQIQLNSAVSTKEIHMWKKCDLRKFPGPMKYKQQGKKHHTLWNCKTKALSKKKKSNDAVNYLEENKIEAVRGRVSITMVRGKLVDLNVFVK